ncbi:MAG: hypothetical protein WC788_07365 [Candidatus Paceibacterota bacterium]|jgi:hypothetical protein
MKTKILTVLFVMSFAAWGTLSYVKSVFGEGVDDANIKYPITELGGCADKAACATFCDKPANMTSCLDYAEKSNMMSKEEVNVAKNFIAAGSEGPGGCKSKESCESYCDDISRIDECVSFAEKNNLMPPDELAQAKKIQAAIAQGVKPPSCGSKKQCDDYCEQPDHMEECINFAAQAGFMNEKEKADAQKMLAAVKKGAIPPPCKGKEACDEYCSAPANLETCTNFAIAAGFMSDEEQGQAQKMLQAVKKGVNPPKCRGKEECDAYCGQDEHFEECLNFAEAAGMMSSDDAVMARKTKGKGPGGCKGKEECEAFCQDPGNQETCFNFAKDNGLISEEDMKKMEEGKQQMQQAFQQMPQEMLECLNTELGADVVEKLKAGTAMLSKDIGDKMGLCGQKMGPQQGEAGIMQPGQTGPGGCTSQEECKTYCESHPDECQQFQPGPGTVNPGDQMMPLPSGPGGCKSPEECQTYCTNNPAECQNFAPAQPQQQLPPLPADSQQPSYPTGEGENLPIAPTGPGGCSSPEECQVYCTNNPSACQNFAPPPPPASSTAPAPDSQTFPSGGSGPYPEGGTQPPPGTAPTYDQPINYTAPQQPEGYTQPLDNSQPPADGQFMPLPPPPPPSETLPVLGYNAIYMLLSGVPRAVFSLFFK